MKLVLLTALGVGGATIIGALIGALVGAIPWAVAYYAGWFVAALGLIVGLASMKGYDYLRGKECRAKPIIVMLATVVAVLIANIVAIAVGVVKGSELTEKINAILANISREERSALMDAAVAAQPLSE